MNYPRLSVALLLVAATAQAASAQSADGAVVIARAGGAVAIDYANAKPFPLPQSRTPLPSQGRMILDAEKFSFDGEASYEPGGRGSGELSPVKLPVSKYLQDDGVVPQEYGTSNMPFTTALQKTPSDDPYRRAGKLFFMQGQDNFICSASLIKPGVVLTAAHCVNDYGRKTLYKGFQFVPALDKGDAPFGVWEHQLVIVPKAYFEGTDKCFKDAEGVVCENDVALIVLKPQKGKYAGDFTGFFGVGVNGYSYTRNNQVLITQLGYPGALNLGVEMMRTDSQGTVNREYANNTIIGSLQTGGSSGGPWLANFGFAPTPDRSVKFGADAARNTVVGVTSWGFGDNAVKLQGASPFTKNNVPAMLKAACGKYKAAC